MVKNDWSPSTSMTPREKYHWAGGVGGNHCRQRNNATFARKCPKTKTEQLLFFAAPQIDREISTLPPPLPPSLPPEPNSTPFSLSLSLPFCRGNRQGCHFAAKSHHVARRNREHLLSSFSVPRPYESDHNFQRCRSRISQTAYPCGLPRSPPGNSNQQRRGSVPRPSAVESSTNGSLPRFLPPKNS